ncbi:MAG: hypothetical protein CSA50_09455 [Gammaproteobacteria bacterium]|nr:MAG: hypothetical protein CSA50_09455 [Gammaproteobacteria bacterium]
MITDIEVINLEGSGEQTITLDADSVKNMTDGNNTLLIKGDGEEGNTDTVNLDSGWVDNNVQDVVDDTTYNVLDNSDNQIKIEDGVNYHIA